MQSPVSESVLSRIRKLQGLTRSSNEHEAALAAAKMQELLFAHNLSLDALREPSDYVEVQRRIGSRVWAKRLLTTLCRNNFCEPLQGGGGMMFAIGRRENIGAVNAMFGYLAAEIQRLAKAGFLEYRLTTPWPETARIWCAGFRNGAVGAIRTRLQQQREHDVHKISASVVGQETGPAIIRRLDLELKAEMARRYPRLRTRRGGSSKADYSDGYTAGIEAGSRMSLEIRRGHLD